MTQIQYREQKCHNLQKRKKNQNIASGPPLTSGDNRYRDS